MENLQKNEKKLLGAFVDSDFVIKFRSYCQENDFKQRSLFRNLTEFWLLLDPILQEHIYRGRLNEVYALMDEASAARDTAKKKRSRSRPHPSKAG